MSDIPVHVRTTNGLKQQAVHNHIHTIYVVLRVLRFYLLTTCVCVLRFYHYRSTKMIYMIIPRTTGRPNAWFKKDLSYNQSVVEYLVIRK